MARVSPILTNFTAGEISPRLLGRVDLARYANACRELTNFIVLPYGGVTRRPGTRFIHACKTVVGKTQARLVPFIFNESDAYVLEFGHNYIRFFREQGIIESGGSPYEIATTIDEDQLAWLRFAQSADVIYIAHPNRAPQKLTRTSHTSWAIANVSFTATPAEWTGTNYPGAVAFFEQRLWWGGTPNEPGKMWASVSGSYEDLTTGTDDDDALIYTIASGRVNKIQWMEPHKRLIIGTVGEEWTAGASSSLDPITPTNVRFERETTHGSANIQGRIIDNALIYVGKHGVPVFETTYDINLDSMKGINLSLLALHLFGSPLEDPLTSGGATAARSGYGVKEWDYQEHPESLLWLVLESGELLSCTYNRQEEVLAWSRHTIGTGETEGVSLTPATIKSVAVIPGIQKYDEVWLVVRRTINEETKNYIEMMEIGYLGESEQNAFLDSSLYYAGDAVTEFSGLDHLEGETVSVWTNRGVSTGKEVVGGEITLDWPAEQVRVGLNYSSVLRTLPLEAGAQDGTSQAKIKRLHKVAVRFHETLGGQVGTVYDRSNPENNKMEDVLLRSSTSRMGYLPDRFSGDKIISLGGHYQREGELWIVQDQPLPMSVLAIMPQATTNDQ